MALSLENGGSYGRNERGLAPQRSLTSCQEVEARNLERSASTATKLVVSLDVLPGSQTPWWQQPVVPEPRA
jgi:hypothetical protein